MTEKLLTVEDQFQEKIVMKKRHSSGRNYKRIYNWYYHCSLSGRKYFSNAKCYYWV